MPAQQFDLQPNESGDLTVKLDYKKDDVAKLQNDKFTHYKTMVVSTPPIEGAPNPIRFSPQEITEDDQLAKLFVPGNAAGGMRSGTADQVWDVSLDYCDASGTSSGVTIPVATITLKALPASGTPGASDPASGGTNSATPADSSAPAGSAAPADSNAPADSPSATG